MQDRPTALISVYFLDYRMETYGYLPPTISQSRCLRITPCRQKERHRLAQSSYF